MATVDPHTAQKAAVDALLPVKKAIEVELNEADYIPVDTGEEIDPQLIADSLSLQSGKTVEVPEELKKEYEERRSGKKNIVEVPTIALDVPDSRTAEVLAGLQEEIRRLRGELTDVREHQIDADRRSPGLLDASYPWQYFRKPVRKPLPGGQNESNWITVGPGGAAPLSGRRDVGSYLTYTSKGLKPITSYGAAPIPSEAGVYGVPGGIFIPMLLKGGAEEFPVEQVLAYKWHVRPPIAGLLFPQVDAVVDQIVHFECQECPLFDLYCLKDDAETYSTCTRHLLINHKLSRQETVMELTAQGFPPKAGRFAVKAQQETFKAAVPELTGE